MPAFNEEEGIRNAILNVVKHVFGLVPAAELIVVDDGSTDNTGAIIDEIAALDRRITVIHSTNRGHGPALITGLERSQSDFVLLVDSDDQIHLSAFALLWQKIAEGYDAAFGVRRVRHDARSRIILTTTIRPVLRMLFGVRFFDANAPFKVLRRSLWECARDVIPPDTLAPSLFLAVFAARRQAKLAFVDVPHRNRETGTASIKRLKLVGFCLRAFRQLLTFRASLAT